jgi:hypothetical protein
MPVQSWLIDRRAFDGAFVQGFVGPEPLKVSTMPSLTETSTQKNNVRGFAIGQNPKVWI